ncbi:unnamed protein product [Durusdinium trenchii]|uniref:Solute carrier family 40 protein n=2 Tax=Durusdinium trenchii TaxID=1381693 RepID=A0ABP0JKZ3_9DINO
MVEKKDDPEEVEFDDDFDDYEDLGWSFNYFFVCILLPTFNGLINGYSWSGLSLHYVEMGWPLTNVGWPCMIGFALRLVFQQVQMRAGFWVSVPLAIFHLGTAIVGMIYTTEEWPVALEIAVMQALDPSITVEGIAFDVFGLSEEQARQASSTVLAVFTIAIASAVTIGGIIYDGFGWKGMSVFHVICQSGMLLLFATQPVVWRSFREFFFKARSKDEEESHTEAALPVVPTEPSGSTQDDLQLEDIDEYDLPGAVKNEALVQFYNPKRRKISSNRGTKASVVVVGRKSQDSQGSSHDSSGSRPRAKTEDSVGSARKSHDSGESSGRKTQDSQGSHGRRTLDAQGSHGEGTRASRASIATRRTQMTMGTRVTGMTRGTVLTGKSARTIRTALTARSQMTRGTSKTQGTVLSRMTALTSFKDSDDFQYHFGAHSALRPAIARRAGGPAEVEEDDNVEDEPKPKGIPKDIRTPSFLIVLCCFNNTAVYVLEFATFAIFFKEFHGWEAATWASLAQTSGDLVAAVMMKVLRNNVDEAENVGWLRRITMQPYNLACLLFCWTLCNLGMISPLLPVAVTAQIIMGTVFVYTMKMSTDLNLFYSMGDTAVFLKLQVNCKNAEAIGGCIFSFLGPFLFEHVSAFFPFMVSTFLSALIFIVFSAGFCQRLGCEEIESAESKRSRRLGLRRVSHWSVVSRKNTVVLPNEQDDAEEEDDS